MLIQRYDKKAFQTIIYEQGNIAFDVFADFIYLHENENVLHVEMDFFQALFLGESMTLFVVLTSNFSHFSSRFCPETNYAKKLETIA